MADFRRLSGYRFVELQYGDTLQRIAQRELGDAGRWHDLIAINDLVPPYITNDPTLAGPKVKLYGEQIVVPATTIQTSAASDPERVFGIDLLLRKGKLDDENGDLAVVAGRANLRQALMNRIGTALRELLFHKNYGCGVHDLKGETNSPTNGVLGAQYVRGALLNDPRVNSVPAARADLSGDVDAISATAKTIAGTSIDILSAV